MQFLVPAAAQRNAEAVCARHAASDVVYQLACHTGPQQRERCAAYAIGKPHPGPRRDVPSRSDYVDRAPHASSRVSKTNLGSRLSTAPKQRLLRACRRGVRVRPSSCVPLCSACGRPLALMLRRRLRRPVGCRRNAPHEDIPRTTRFSSLIYSWPPLSAAFSSP